MQASKNFKDHTSGFGNNKIGIEIDSILSGKQELLVAWKAGTACSW
jgi:hypothetical protein